MNLYDFSFSFVEEDNYISAYIDFLMRTSGKSLKENLAAMQLPASSYHYCMKKGFKNSYFTLEMIEQYFHVKFTYNPETLKKLEQIHSRGFTESFFVSGNDIMKQLREEVYQLKDECRNNVLYPVYALVAISLLELPDKIEEHKKEVPAYIDVIEGVYNALPVDVQYWYRDCLSQYYMSCDDSELVRYPQLIEDILSLDNVAPEELKTVAYYDLSQLYFCIHNLQAALDCTKKCETLYIKYFNPQRLNFLRNNLTAIAFACHKYDEAAISAKSNLVYASREAIKPVLYKSLIMILVSCQIFLKKYSEAERSLKLFYENNFEDYYPQAILMKMYIRYKEEDYAQFDQYQKELLAIVKDKKAPAYVLSELIINLSSGKKKDMKDFGAKLKEIFINPFNGYRQICEFLKLEYTEYLKKNNRYVEVFDM